MIVKKQLLVFNYIGEKNNVNTVIKH